MSNAVIGGFSASLILRHYFNSNGQRRQHQSCCTVVPSLILFLSWPFIMSIMVPVISAKLLPDVYWNSSNRIFRIDNTDHVFGVKIRDRVNIKCPNYDPSTVFDPKQVEYSEIYNVPRWGYDNCMLTAEAKIVGVCRTPFHESVITVVFREFTPLPGGLEFIPGRSYYFITTSNGTQNGLSNRQGGLCEQRNMKLKFEVQPLEDDSTVVDENDPSPGGDHNPPAINPRWPNVKIPSDINSDKQVDLKEQNSDTMLNSNSGEQISSPLSRPSQVQELMTTTTSIWYEIHTRDPDDIYSQQKNNNKNINNNQKINNSDKQVGGEVKVNSDDSAAFSNSRRNTGASKYLDKNFFLLTLYLFCILSSIRLGCH